MKIGIEGFGGIEGVGGINTGGGTGCVNPGGGGIDGWGDVI
jgi:hypothetical protein